MTEPYSLDTILSEFDEKTIAWVLNEKTSGLYVTIPHPKYPSKNPMHFFLSEADAKSVLVELLEENEKLNHSKAFQRGIKLTEINFVSAEPSETNIDNYYDVFNLAIGDKNKTTYKPTSKWHKP